MKEYEFDLDVIKYRQARGYNQCEICRDGDIDALIFKVEELTKENENLTEENEQMFDDLEALINE